MLDWLASERRLRKQISFLEVVGGGRVERAAGRKGVLESTLGTQKTQGQGLVAHTQDSGKWAVGRGYPRQVTFVLM